MKIETVEQLRQLYPPPKDRAVRKQLPALDVHCRRYIALSPFLVIATSNRAGQMDASPRGGPGGFVKVISPTSLLIPDSPGNNRLDTLENILATRAVGLLFMIPGIDETLRVNGTASLSCDEDHLREFAGDSKAPRLVIQVSVNEVYLHCAKAFMRSRLWDASRAVSRSVLPSLGEMIHSQIGEPAPTETQEEMVRRYQAEL